jgi:tetratricopeptide (TPR) repeat protein
MAKVQVAAGATKHKEPEPRQTRHLSTRLGFDYRVRPLLRRDKLIDQGLVGLRAIVIGLLLFVVVSAPLAADAREDAKDQVQFGIRVAQLGLWREAVAHWERAAKIDPTYAPAYNNLAIGYEQQGDFEKARAAYEKAIELNPNNTYIKQNYELFKEINDRTNKPDGR